MNKSPQEAEALLSKSDCVVTNMSDKMTQLKKLATHDEDVQHLGRQSFACAGRRTTP